MKWALAVVALFLASPVAAETDETFVVGAFPACKSAPVFSPYPAGAIGGQEPAEPAAWFAKLKPISSAPCVANGENGAITFCARFVCQPFHLVAGVAQPSKDDPASVTTSGDNIAEMNSFRQVYRVATVARRPLGFLPYPPPSVGYPPDTTSNVCSVPTNICNQYAVNMLASQLPELHRRGMPHAAILIFFRYNPQYNDRLIALEKHCEDVCGWSNGRNN
jgi:hypothetical protein